LPRAVLLGIGGIAGRRRDRQARQERFVDHASGRLVTVFFSPSIGAKHGCGPNIHKIA
jgi:hypothetical protein